MPAHPLESRIIESRNHAGAAARLAGNPQPHPLQAPMGLCPRKVLVCAHAKTAPIGRQSRMCSSSIALFADPRETRQRRNGAGGAWPSTGHQHFAQTERQVDAEAQRPRRPRGRAAALAGHVPTSYGVAPLLRSSWGMELTSLPGSPAAQATVRALAGALSRPSRDGAARDGSLRDGVVRHGSARDGAASDNAALGSAAREGTVRDGVAPDDSARHGAVRGVAERRGTGSGSAVCGGAAHRRQLTLAVLREARFAGGLHCVRCGSRQVQRWGRASGRQRYRCRTCGRTSSDLTGTPLAYCKHVELWGAYAEAMREGISVREAARRLGISKDTAFRWRHRLLAQLEPATRPRPGGIVELEEVRFPYSEKGRRVSGRLPRRRGLKPGHQYREGVPSVCAIVACDRAGGAASGLAGLHRPASAALRNWLLPLLARPCTIVGEAGPLSPYGIACAGTGIRYRRAVRSSGAPGPRAFLLHSTGRARARAARLRAWLLRFRGVSTRYLEHYLRWHLAVDVEPTGLPGPAGGWLLLGSRRLRAEGTCRGGDTRRGGDARGKDTREGKDTARGEDTYRGGDTCRGEDRYRGGDTRQGGDTCRDEDTHRGEDAHRGEDTCGARGRQPPRLRPPAPQPAPRPGARARAGPAWRR